MTNQLDESSQNQNFPLGSKENPILVETIDAYNNLKRQNWFLYYCKDCGVLCKKKKETTYIKQDKQRRFLCKPCGTKQTNLETYGTEYSFQSEIVKDKIKQTNIERYGVKCSMQSDKVKQKSRETCLEKYGVEYTSQTKEVKKKRKETFIRNYGVDNPNKCQAVLQKRKETIQNRTDEEKQQILEKQKQTTFKKYGVEHYSKTKEFKEKSEKTMLDRYGVKHALQNKEFLNKSINTMQQHYGENVENISQVESIKQKKKETCIKNYGVENPSQSDTIKDKRKNTFIEKFGVENPFMNEDVKDKIVCTLQEKYGVDNAHFLYKKYQYNEETFDSFWELAFYVYYIDNNIPIKREPIGISYIHNEKEHVYYPDFEVNGQLYEIKGDQFWKEDGTMQNPYDPTQDALFEAKHQCGLRNNVIFICDTEIKPYLDYVENKYGSNFKDNCKIN